MPHVIGLKNKIDASAKDSVTDASSNSVKAKLIGDLVGTIYNKTGKEVQTDVSIKGVAYMPESKYNLFSITKRILDGWTLGGDDNTMWLRKDGKEIKFDIKIKTPKSAIVCMYMKQDVGPEEI